MRASQGWVYLKEQELRGWRAQGVVLGYAPRACGPAGEAGGGRGGRRVAWGEEQHGGCSVRTPVGAELGQAHEGGGSTSPQPHPSPCHPPIIQLP